MSAEPRPLTPTEETLAAALTYASKGWPVLALWWPTPTGCACGLQPCDNNGKHPLTDICPNGVYSATTDPATIRSWFTRFPDMNIGIATGRAAGVWVLDIDPRNGGDVTLDALEHLHGKLPTSCRVETGSGGHHIFWIHPKDGKLSGSGKRMGGPGIDVKVDGGYVVAAPSMHASGRRYVWEDEESSTLTDAPLWLLHRVGAQDDDVYPSGPVVELAEAEAGVVANSKLARAIKRIRSGDARHPVALWLFRQLRDNGVPRATAEVVVDQLMPVCQEGRIKSDLMKRHELTKILVWAYKTAARGLSSALTQEIAKLARIPSDLDRHKPLKELSERTKVPIGLLRSEVEKVKRDQRAVAAPDADAWRSRLIVSTTGKTEHWLHNAALVLQNHPEWKGQLKWNSFEHLTETTGKPFGQPGRWSDQLTAQAMAWLQEQEHISVSTDTANQAIDMAAHANAYDPVLDYLKGLVWDGEERLDHWLEDVCGAERTPYTIAVGRKWLISGVARARRPGCKADHVLILEGAQGAKKSTTFEALFDPWFTDEIAELGDKDSSMQVAGVWGIELSELDSISRNEASRTKAFLSRKTDRFRPAYGKIVVEVPRRAIFCGTTNKPEHLNDDTGNRRYWCVKAATLDPDMAAKWRSQLWAEAVVAYEKGETWWLEDEALIKQAAEEQEERFIADAWEMRIQEVLDTWGQGDVTTGEVLRRIGVDVAHQDRGSQMRAAACLSRLRLKKTVRRDGPRTYRLWERVST